MKFLIRIKFGIILILVLMVYLTLRNFENAEFLVKIRRFSRMQVNEYLVPECNCTKRIFLPHSFSFFDKKTNSSISSSCNEHTFKYGFGQKVISYALYDGTNTTAQVGDGRHPKIYVKALEKNIQLMRKWYWDDWLMRIYSDVSLTKYPEFCSSICNNDDVLWCDVRKIPSLGDITSTFGMNWRFIPIGDPYVDVFLSRDLDSPLTKRERVAVQEWMETNKTFHVMRDNIQHGAPILGGTWAAKNNKMQFNDSLRLQKYFVDSGKKFHTKGWDQSILAWGLYNQQYYNSILAHDSYLCGTYQMTECRPFPEQAQLQGSDQDGEHFVGCLFPDFFYNDTIKPNIMAYKGSGYCSVF